MTRDADLEPDSETQPEGAAGASPGEAASPPLLRVISPNATPEEIAALVTVFAALRKGEQAPRRRTTPEWQSPHRKVRRTFPPGPGGWRASALPR